MRAALVMIIATTLIFLGGCGKQYYPNTQEKNFTVNTSLDYPRLTARDGILRKIDAAVGIHYVDNLCEPEYLGFVPMTNGSSVEIGLRPNRLSLIVVEVATKFFGGGGHVTKREFLFTPATGRQYQLDINYDQGMFGLDLLETGGGGEARRLKLEGLSACR